jgi:hypothetical protein
MRFAKHRSIYSFLIILSSLLVSTAIFAVDKRDIPSAPKANFHPRDISLQNEVNGFFKPSRWGNDDTIATGPVYLGISSDYDTSGNLYAVRCTTYVDSINADIRVYKSTDGGQSWFYFTDIYYPNAAYRFSYPVVVTGSNPNKVYVFALSSYQNGDIGVGRLSQNGTWEGWHYVKANADTITYFSACTDDGSHLMVAYQKDENWHQLYTITSTDSGQTWGNETLVCSDGAHPDITYGSNGYVYVVFESTGMTKGNSADVDKEIWFRRNTNYCAPGSWGIIEYLTDDSYEDSYPKVAALHTTPESTACVWVAYNHESAGEDTLKYDNNAPAYYWRLPNPAGVDSFNVRFTPAWDYWLKSAQFMFYHKVGTAGARIYVWADTNGYPAQKIDSVDVPHDSIKVDLTWTTVNFPAKKLVLTDQSDFHIGYASLGDPSRDTLAIISDNGLPAGTEHRSIEFYNGAWVTMYNDWGYDYNFMIRAVVTRVQSTDLRFAYSTNSGKDWSKDHELANSSQADEMAADLKTYRSSTNVYVDLCYVKYSGVLKSGSDICYTWAGSEHPEQFSSPHEIVNEHWADWSPDSRGVCQLTYPVYDGYPGIVYAGAPPAKDNAGILVDGAWNLYYDYHGWVGVEETAEEKLPTEFSLSNNYPNPFNPETKIGYLIPKACQVKLEVFNILGQRVKTLVDEVQTAGKKEVTWDGKGENGNEVASGVYFYKLQAGDFTQTKKMVLIR